MPSIGAKRRFLREPNPLRRAFVPSTSATPRSGAVGFYETNGAAGRLVGCSLRVYVPARRVRRSHGTDI